MMQLSSFFRRVIKSTRRFKFLLVLVLAMGVGRAFAHPMPNTILLLDIQDKGVTAELQLPLSELELAFGQNVTTNSETLVARLGPQLRAYIIAHVRPFSADHRAWSVQVFDLKVESGGQDVNLNAGSGPYQELTAHLWLQAPEGASSRNFTLKYDVIIHQVVTHAALVSIRQDWENGTYGENPLEVGVIRLDVPTNTIPPLEINQAEGSLWRGFQSMVALGMHHISEGTDHLLFLLVLLLPAPLLVGKGRWGAFGGVRYSVFRLLKVVTAFTLGHSLTLLAGAVGWLHLPSQPVEILIAFSILVSALHAIRPFFAGREAYVAAGFGLVHGLAFASTLANLNLDAQRMGLSILGFNMGIEIMQLFVIAITVPWLILISRTPAYSFVRITGACLAGVAALAWMSERFFGKANVFTTGMQKAPQYAPWLLGVLAFGALVSVWWERSKKKPTPLS